MTTEDYIELETCRKGKSNFMMGFETYLSQLNGFLVKVLLEMQNYSFNQFNEEVLRNEA